MKGDAVTSLHALLERIYVPLLRQGEAAAKKDGKGKGKVNAQVRDLLYSLRSGLKRTLLRGFGDLRGWNPSMFGGILEPTDEIEIWQEVAENNQVQEIQKFQKSAELICKHFSKV